MPEHFTKSTTEAKFWCKKCAGPAMHFVFDGRRGSCQACLKKLDTERLQRAAVKPAAAQESLF